MDVIIVEGTIEVDPAERDAFLASRAGIMRRSRSEEGCLEYCFAADPLEANRVVLVERWASEEALDRHVAVLRGDPPPGKGDVVPVASSVAVYEVTAARALGG